MMKLVNLNIDTFTTKSFSAELGNIKANIEISGNDCAVKATITINGKVIDLGKKAIDIEFLQTELNNSNSELTRESIFVLWPVADAAIKFRNRKLKAVALKG